MPVPVQVPWIAVRWVVVLAWGLALAVLVRRVWWEWPGGLAPYPSPPGVTAAGEEWFGIYQAKQKVGYAQQSLVAADGGFRFVHSSLVRLKVLDTPQTVRTLAEGTIDAARALRSMTFELTSGPGRLRVTARVEGGALVANVQTGSETTAHSIPVVEPVYLPSLVRGLIGMEPLSAGRVLDAFVFDPMLIGGERIRLVVEGEDSVPGTAEPQRGWRVREEFRGMQETLWLDDAGRVLREEGPMGLVMVREDAQRAVSAGWKDGMVLDVVSAVAVPVEQIDNPRTRPTLRLRLTGIPVGRVPSDDVQRWDGTTVAVRPPQEGQIGTYALPYRGGDHAVHLAAEPLVQSTHPRVRALAEATLGGVVDAKEAVRALNDWVYRTLRKAPTVTIPNALQVLDIGEGDCNEHAVLLAALTRASGIPTRLVAGVVYVDGAFLYHAWCEVWLGLWVPVDPAFGQFPADATHVKFVAGGLEEHFAMVEVIGRLRIDLVDSRDDRSG